MQIFINFYTIQLFQTLSFMKLSILLNMEENDKMFVIKIKML